MIRLQEKYSGGLARGGRGEIPPGPPKGAAGPPHPTSCTSGPKGPIRPEARGSASCFGLVPDISVPKGSSQGTEPRAQVLGATWDQGPRPGPKDQAPCNSLVIKKWLRHIQIFFTLASLAFFNVLQRHCT